MSHGDKKPSTLPVHQVVLSISARAGINCSAMILTWQVHDRNIIVSSKLANTTGQKWLVELCEDLGNA